MTATASFLLDGSRGERAEPLVLRAGPLSLRFEDGGLRYIRWGQHEVVRRVYCAVRDANWGTVPHHISNLCAEIRDDSFNIEFDVVHRQAEINFAWHGAIIGEACGRVAFDMDGQARSTFSKNRIGFCVLHPMQCADTPVEIRHADGSTERSRFPRYIAAQNPFLDIVELRYPVEPGIEIAVAFEGEVFETEDQRNWIDASFKTFCTPLSRPFPVEMRTGERLFQRVIIELRGQSSPAIASRTDDGAVTLELAPEAVSALPQIGLSIAPDTGPLRPIDIQRIRHLRPSHLRCELHLTGNFATALRHATSVAQEISTNTALEVALFLSPQCDQQLSRLIELVTELQPPIARWIVFPANGGWCTTRELAEFAAKFLRRHDATRKIPIGGGTPANFFELNRGRPPIDVLDFVNWSLTPQCHAFDNASLVETLAAHAATVESARHFAGDKPVVVGPITLKMQVNPYATGQWPPPLPADQLPPQVDVRQMSLFGAGWTLGSLKYLAESQVHAATYYELVGWKGLMENQSGSPLPDLFPSMPGGVFPLYHVLTDVNSQPDAEVVPVRSSDPLRVEALALRSRDPRWMPGVEARDAPASQLPLTDFQIVRVFVANLSDQPQTVRLRTSAKSARVKMLDERNVVSAMRTPEIYTNDGEDWYRPTADSLILTLLPYAIARVSLA